MEKNKALVEELAWEGPLVFYDDSITLDNPNYFKKSKKFLFEHVKVKGKHVTQTWCFEINIKNTNPTRVLELHIATSEALAHTVEILNHFFPIPFL